MNESASSSTRGQQPAHSASKPANDTIHLDSAQHEQAHTAHRLLLLKGVERKSLDDGDSNGSAIVDSSVINLARTVAVAPSLPSDFAKTVGIGLNTAPLRPEIIY